MARRSEAPARDRRGRFIERREVRSSGSQTGGRSRTDARRAGIGKLTVLSLAMVMAFLGFVFSLFWIASLVLMGILWGTMAMEGDRRPGERKGLVAEVVGVVVDEAKDVAEFASGHDASHDRSHLDELSS